ncbi:MAG: zinc-dependent metalloprotease [Isosphaeraceae bacterium]
MSRHFASISSALFALAVAVGLLPVLLGADKPRSDDGDPSDFDVAPARGKNEPKAGQPSPSDKKYKDFNEVTRGAQTLDGFFTLHRKDENLYAEIKPSQFDQPMLVPIAIARGLAMAGQPLNFGDEWVITFHRAGDKVQVIRKNVHYKAPSGTPIEKAVKQNYTDSILLALPILSVNNSNQAVLIDFSDIFLHDFAQLGFGSFDRNRTSWNKIKAFPNNIELEVEATFTGYGGGGGFFFGGDDGVIDPRGRTVIIHYSLARLPEGGYHPRYADDRVGHFLNTTKDFGQSGPDGPYVRMINRWRLEKADPKAKLSPPKKQIIWYVEDTVPLEYRPYVEEGIREWNKAFEKIGFRDAIAVRWQESGRDDFDPEDINYCTFRWITTSGTFAMSCLRSNPLTGEMIDGDVIFDASWIRYWKQEYAFLTGNPIPTGAGDRASSPTPIAAGRILSPIMAAKKGYGSPFPMPAAMGQANEIRPGEPRLDVVPAGWNDLQVRLRQRQFSGRSAACQYMHGMRSELGLTAIALAARSVAEADDKDKDKSKEKDKEEVKLPEEFLGQMIKEVVMHEVGHSLGLRHNFKASTMLTADQLNDPSVTRVKGLSGSVMDYNPINIAPKGQKQGDYNTTTLGPYDYWAIEYAYKVVDGDEKKELEKVAERSTEPDLVFATDEDMMLNNDPLVNTYDLGSDNLRFAKDRIALAAELLKDLDAKVVKDGESFARVRDAFSILLDQWGNGSYLVASYVGGQSVARDHKGKGARDPIAPVASTKQRDALNFLVDQILSDKAFKFSPALLRRLANEKWYDWGGSSYGVDYPLYEEILGIQRISLSQCLSADVLSRLQNQELQVDSGSDCLRIAEVFRSLTDGIWSETSNPTSGQSLKLGTIRRNLQREHLKKLATIALGSRQTSYSDLYAFISFGGGGSYPADARSVARMHLKEIGNRIGKVLNTKDLQIDDTTRAHLEESAQRISRILDARVQANEP